MSVTVLRAGKDDATCRNSNGSSAPSPAQPVEISPGHSCIQAECAQTISGNRPFVRRPSVHFILWDQSCQGRTAVAITETGPVGTGSLLR